MNAQDHVEPGRQVRPWVRLWVRYIDLCLSASVCGLIWDTIGPPVNTKYVVICILPAFLWVPVESLLLSTWGYNAWEMALENDCARFDRK